MSNEHICIFSEDMLIFTCKLVCVIVCVRCSSHRHTKNSGMEMEHYIWLDLASQSAHLCRVLLVPMWTVTLQGCPGKLKTVKYE